MSAFRSELREFVHLVVLVLVVNGASVGLAALLVMTMQHA